MNTDIAAILFRIKENVKSVETGDHREPILHEIETDYLDLIELIKLFLISERDSYYGCFMMNMQFRADFCANTIAGIKLNTFPPVFVANPLLLCKFTLKEIMYIVCHEIDHVLLNHPAEMVKANPSQDPDIFYRFNLAADAAVNDRINHEIISEKHKFLSQPDGIITSAVLKKMFNLGSIRMMENYAYYFDLIKNKGQQGNESSNGQQNMMDEQNKKDNIEPENGNDSDEPEGQDKIVTAGSCGGNITDHDWEAGEDAEDAAAAVREFVNSSVDMMSNESRGQMPGSFITQVEKINKPPVISWQAVLKKYVGTITANKRKTRMRLNRRQPERYDLSGAVDNKVLKIVVAIDTSASVDDAMIAKILNEIFAILAKRKHEITVIECDYNICRIYRAKTPADIKNKVHGRGGTRFTPVIEHVNSDKYYRDALLIYFTDGYGERSIPRPRTYRNIWVVFDDKDNLSVKEPYGAVLTL